jgi:hypothetical protein
MKLLCTLLVLLATAAAPGVAHASDAHNTCYLPPQTVTVAGHTASTPSVLIPCP